MSNVAEAYTQLVGDGEITVPSSTQAMTVAFEHDGLLTSGWGSTCSSHSRSLPVRSVTS